MSNLCNSCFSLKLYEKKITVKINFPTAYKFQLFDQEYGNSCGFFFAEKKDPTKYFF